MSTSHVRIPPERGPILERVEQLHESEVRPREDALSHRLTNSRLYLDDDGRIHPEVWEARREIMRAFAEAGLYSLQLPKDVGGGGLGRTEIVDVETRSTATASH